MVLDIGDARWLRDRLDEELALLDGDEVTGTDLAPSGKRAESGGSAATAETPAADEGRGNGVDGDVQSESHADDDPGESEDDGDGAMCPECGEEFKSERGVNIHRAKVHGDEDDTADGESEPEDADHGQDDGGDDRVDDDARNGGGNPADTEVTCPVCSESFGNAGQMCSHRDDSHDETEVASAYREQVREDLPRNVSIADVEQSVAAHKTVYEVQQDLRVPRDQLKLMVSKLQLDEVLDEHSEVQSIHLIEDLHDELGIDEPVPEVPGKGVEGGG